MHVEMYDKYNNIIAGLQILAKYGEQNTCAEHDVLYAGPSFSRSYVSDEDKVALKSFGWHWSDDAYSWGFFT